jgi:hypothetical protein
MLNAPVVGPIRALDKSGFPNRRMPVRNLLSAGVADAAGK